MAKEKSSKKTYKFAEGPFRVVNLSQLASAAKVDYHKVRFTVVGRYKDDNLTQNERTQLANALYAEVRHAFKYLGFDINPHHRLP